MKKFSFLVLMTLMTSSIFFAQEKESEGADMKQAQQPLSGDGWAMVSSSKVPGTKKETDKKESVDQPKVSLNSASHESKELKKLTPAKKRKASTSQKKVSGDEKTLSMKKLQSSRKKGDALDEKKNLPIKKLTHVTQKKITKPASPQAAPSQAEQVQTKEAKGPISPAPVAQQQVIQKETERIELKIKHGERLNWLAVREWFEHAQDTINEIVELVPVVAQQRERYIAARDQVDDTIDKTFTELSLNPSRLATLIDYIIKQLEDIRRHETDLTDQEKSVLQKMESKRPVLESLKMHIEMIQEEENGLDAVVQRVMEQIRAVSAYQKQAHDYFEKVPEGTIQAKEGFYHVDAALKSIEAVKNYLGQTLWTYFSKQIDKVQNMLTMITGQLTGLKKDGLEIQQQAKRLDILTKNIEERQQEKKRDAEQPDSQEGFFSRVFSAIGSFFSSLWNRMFGSSDVAK